MPTRTQQRSRREVLLLPCSNDRKAPAGRLKLRTATNPLANGTLGDVGLAVEVVGAAEEEFAETILVQPFERMQLAGVDAGTIRAFRYDRRARGLVPVWNSGINLALGFVWTRIRRPGLYVALGLPRDRLL